MTDEKNRVQVNYIKPSLDRDHKYAVGVKIEGGGFAPIHSYKTLAALEAGYAEFYNFAKEGNITLPLAVEKLEEKAEWDGSRCKTLPEFTKRIIESQGQGKN